MTSLFGHRADTWEELKRERQKSAELAAALVQLRRERDELRGQLDAQFDARRVEEAASRLLADHQRVIQERDALCGEVLGLQRMLEEALKPGFNKGACPWCHRPLTARGVTLHLPHCRQRPSGVGHS